MVEPDYAKHDTEHKWVDRDISFIRALEDVVDLLILKGIISKKDLTSNAIEKYDERKSLREEV